MNNRKNKQTKREELKSKETSCIPWYLQPIFSLLHVMAATSWGSMERVLPASILQLAAYGRKHTTQHIVWCQIHIQKWLFFSTQVLTLATIKVAVKLHWLLNNTVSSLCHAQLGLETGNVFSRKCSNLHWDFCSFAFYVNCTYAWIWWWEVYRILLFLKQD